MTNISDTTDSRPGSSERYVALARAAILWERVWPALWPASGIVAAFLVPVIVALRAGFGYREDLNAEAALKP